MLKVDDGPAEVNWMRTQRLSSDLVQTFSSKPGWCFDGKMWCQGRTWPPGRGTGEWWCRVPPRGKASSTPGIKRVTRQLILGTHLCHGSLEQERHDDDNADRLFEQLHVEVLHAIDGRAEGIGEAEH